jgi:hypothetical protein
VVVSRLQADTLIKLNSMMRSTRFGDQIRTLTPDAIQSCQATTG